MNRLLPFALLPFLALACRQNNTVQQEPSPAPPARFTQAAAPAAPDSTRPVRKATQAAPDTPARHGFSDVAALDPGIRFDIRYATTNNFTKAKIYDCPRCLLRPEAAEALVGAHKALQKKNNEWLPSHTPCARRQTGESTAQHHHREDLVSSQLSRVPWRPFHPHDQLVPEEHDI
ncbi:MAG TPA: M15 family metallopeptidase [Saprospiraceae bacterium]|nr:M15 family metallopeptidase [Saprospiraceae bacterium]